jgi:hypothetical protein
MMEKTELSAQFIFTESGYLKAILLNAETAAGQATLERAMDRLLKAQHFSWIKKLFKN